MDILTIAWPPVSFPKAIYKINYGPKNKNLLWYYFWKCYVNPRDFTRGFTTTTTLGYIARGCQILFAYDSSTIVCLCHVRCLLDVKPGPIADVILWYCLVFPSFPFLPMFPKVGSLLLFDCLAILHRGLVFFSLTFARGLLRCSAFSWFLYWVFFATCLYLVVFYSSNSSTFQNP